MALRPLELTKENMKGQTEPGHFMSRFTIHTGWQCLSFLACSLLKMSLVSLLYNILFSAPLFSLLAWLTEDKHVLIKSYTKFDKKI